MKKWFFCLLAALIIDYSSVYAQSDQPGDVVIVRRWDHKSFFIADAFWEGKEDTINAQLGEGGLECVKKCSDPRFIPSAFLITGGNRSIKDLGERLSKLKNIRKVAVFNHTTGGKDYGGYVVIEVPYADNRDWQPGIQWCVICFILPEKDVEIN